MKRFTIGVLINQLEGMYQVPLWKSILRKAEELDLNVILFTGKSPDSPVNFEFNENVIYELAYTPVVDGLIFVSGALINDIGPKMFIEFFESYKDKPKVSISIPIEGYPSILIDNKKAMKEVVNHLIKVHKCRKIAFISGLKTHPEAMARLEGYKESLLENGLEYDENLVLPGDFRIDTGREAVRILFNERKIFPEAIVAANDNMALSAYQELKRMGIAIPDEILLTGFDNQKDIQYTEPPITTVRQPLEEEGELAVELIYRMLKGEKISDRVWLDCELIIRQSCGCLGLDLSEEIPLEILQTDENLYLKRCIKEYQRVFSPSTSFGSIIDSIFSSINEIKKKEVFLKKLNQIILKSDGDERFLLDAYNFFNYLAGSCEGKREMSWYYDVFQKSLYLVNMALRRKEGREKLELDWLMQMLRQFTQRLYSVASLEELKDVLRNSIHSFRIKFFSLIMYNEEPLRINQIKWILPESSRVECYYLIKENSSEFHNEQIEFVTSDFFPSQILPQERFSLAVMSIYNRDKHFGFIVTDVNYRENELLYVYLQENIGLSLRLLSLWMEQKKSQEKLEKFNIELKEMAEKDSLTGLYNRRGFFERGEKMVEYAREKNLELILFFIDLDNLKGINDSFGHKEGDEALKQTALILKSSFRTSDLIARVGGDEFVAMAINKKRNPSLESGILKRLSNTLNRYNSTSTKGYRLDFSIGSHRFSGDTIFNLESILNIVDEKLYQEKRRKKIFRQT